MTQHLHPGPHLDADQLNAFAEGVLPEHERQHALAHLAECADCRQVVFLAQEPLPEPTTQPAAKPFWRRWFGPLALAGAVATVAVLVIVSLNPHLPPPLPIQNEATNRTPTPQPPDTSSNAAPQPPPPKRAPETPPQVSSQRLPTVAPLTTQPNPNASLALSPQAQDAAPAVDKPAPVANAPTRASIHGSIAAAPIMPSSAALATPAAAPAPPPPAPDAQRYKELPYINRNLAAPTATAPGALNLRIEHNQTPADFSAINGSVTDPTGATVSGATITLRQLPGSATTQTATNAAGQFNIPTLPAGQYEMQITSPGFKSQTSQIELQPHDLAQLDSKLSIGAVSETVTVESANNQLATQDITSAGLVADAEAALPGKRKAVITVASGATVLALDADGKLYRRTTGGRRWKTVQASWPGKVAQLSLTPTSKPNAPEFSQAAPLPHSAPPPAVFRLTTVNGSVWVSNDGEHWRPL